MNRLTLWTCSVFLSLLIAVAAPRQTAHPTALDKYVHASDSSYTYRAIAALPGKGYTVHVLDMTSQSWRTPAEVDRTLWKHWLNVIIPDHVESETGLLFIGSGNNRSKPPEKADAMLANIAVRTHSVVAELRMVPNQPLTFSDDGKPRVEDEMIAYTWDKFLRTGDESWPARLPMTKATLRAMDTVTAYAAGLPRKMKVNRFVVSGASKRGWTAWTTAAVDDRVVAIMPIVIDMLNIEPSFIHHYRVYGFWAPAVHDYVDMGIMDWQGTSQYKALMKLVEPYSYRDRLTMPKYLINSTGDQFFLPDSSQFYFDDLKGEKYLRYVPNTDHSLRNSDAPESLLAYYSAFLGTEPRPQFTWKFEKNGSIRVETKSTKPVAVKLWQASNPEKRDFRLETIGRAYQAADLNPVSEGMYVAKITPPAKGWTASFIELTYSSRGKVPFKFTTPVRVLPDRLPFKAPRPVRKK